MSLVYVFAASPMERRPVEAAALTGAAWAWETRENWATAVGHPQSLGGKGRMNREGL